MPLAQYVSEPVLGIETPGWENTDRYVPEEDPLQKMPERRGGAALFYYHCDQIGTPQLLTDDDGDVVWEGTYKAWGEAREIVARVSKAAGIAPRNPLRFQGQQIDEETGLHYNRHRYYDPSSGRLISKDPIGLIGGINVYQYAPNPIGWIDPLGLKKCRPCPEDCEKILSESGRKFGPYNNVPADSHHVIQNAAMKGVPGYDDAAANAAPSVQLAGPSHEIGSEHYVATQSQRQRGVGGTYAAERRVAYRALRRAGFSADETRCHVMRADNYFSNMGVTADTPTRVPGNRNSSTRRW